MQPLSQTVLNKSALLVRALFRRNLFFFFLLNYHFRFVIYQQRRWTIMQQLTTVGNKLYLNKIICRSLQNETSRWVRYFVLFELPHDFSQYVLREETTHKFLKCFLCFVCFFLWKRWGEWLKRTIPKVSPEITASWTAVFVYH